VSLGRRNRGSSATDLVFAIVVFDRDEIEDCTTLKDNRPDSSFELKAWQEASPEISGFS
jgi:hypothetical protein